MLFKIKVEILRIKWQVSGQLTPNQKKTEKTEIEYLSLSTKLSSFYLEDLPSVILITYSEIYSTLFIWLFIYKVLESSHNFLGNEIWFHYTLIERIIPIILTNW